jgi:hypothetical protein
MTTDNFCFYLQNRLIQTSQTGGQWYSDTSPFSIPWLLKIIGRCLLRRFYTGQVSSGKNASFYRCTCLTSLCGMTINSLVGTRSQGKCCYLLLTLFAKDNIVKIFSISKPVSIYKTVSLLSTDTAVFATRLSIRAFSIPAAFSAVMLCVPFLS